ncbi:hypothetical protein CYMTET_11710 [Cymbomonas tetramitiformis]|uniref:Uncharacterized protein n=1 Tax=Cymbomonas tetramitiformis TaxID=36881 RepID=A0AAE0LD74_9CHLO|nr:hypothetical protein CYMTET_11710 [Cymbomonas tetramitiformis]
MPTIPESNGLDGGDQDGSGGDDGASDLSSESDSSSETTEEDPHEDDFHLEDTAKRMLRKIRVNFFNPIEPAASDDSEGDDVHLNATVLANRFILDLLEAHSAHNSTQSYFDTILEILRRRICGMELDNETEVTDEEMNMPRNYQSCIRFFKDFIKNYKEIDVCQKCNFLFKDLLPEEAPTYSRGWQSAMLEDPDFFEDKRNLSVLLCADGIEKFKDKKTGICDTNYMPSGGALAFYTAIQNRWYTTGRHHSAVLYPSSSPRAHALTTATQGQKKKAPTAPATGTPAATVATPADAPASSVRWADRSGSPPARVPSLGPQEQPPGSANPNRQDSTSSSTRRYHSPRRDASQQEIEKYEQQLLDQAAARHPGKANTDTTPKGSWDGYRFTPDPAQGKLMPCRACYSTHTITVHHSLGRAGCPCTIQERAQTWQKARQHQSARQPAMHSATTSLPITTAPPASSAPRGAPPQQPVHQSLPPPVSAVSAQTPLAPSGTAAVAGHGLAQLSALVAQQIAQQQAAQQPPPSRYYQNPQAGPQYFCWTSQPHPPSPWGTTLCSTPRWLSHLPCSPPPSQPPTQCTSKDNHKPSRTGTPSNVIHACPPHRP